jgi:alpha-aminoadipate carrier protein LysW
VQGAGSAFRILNSSFQKRSLIMSTVTCPECEAQIEWASGTEVGEIIVCSDCGVDLEVVSLDPATVQLAPMEQEDWGE